MDRSRLYFDKDISYKVIKILLTEKLRYHSQSGRDISQHFTNDICHILVKIFLSWCIYLLHFGQNIYQKLMQISVTFRWRYFSQSAGPRWMAGQGAGDLQDQQQAGVRHQLVHIQGICLRTNKKTNKQTKRIYHHYQSLPPAGTLSRYLIKTNKQKTVTNYQLLFLSELKIM